MQAEPKSQISNIDQAIAAIMGQVGYVQKTKSPNLNYTYASEADLIAAIRPWMVEYGVTAEVTDINLVTFDQYTTAKGTVMHRVRAMIHARFVHAASGTSKVVKALGEGTDTGDKASNKASTAGFKYCLRQTFTIETGDDPDQFKSESEATLDEKKALFLAKAGTLGYGTAAKPDKAAIKAMLEPLKLYPYAPELEPAALHALETAKKAANG
jgi:hypothetical protein